MAFLSGSRIPRAPSQAALTALESALNNLRLSLPTLTTVQRRNASHQAQGRANGAADGAGKRLGAKKTAGQYVVTGNIIYKQRGTVWFPGENALMGRDHTIHAATPGYVCYYRDPARDPKRKFIGVVFERNQTLPSPANAPRRRRLGMLAHQMPADPSATTSADGVTSLTGDVLENLEIPIPPPERSTSGVASRSTYQYRPTNWDIGRAAVANGKEASVEKFDRGDRFLAWRKRVVRKQKWLERRAITRSTKTKVKPKVRKAQNL